MDDDLDTAPGGFLKFSDEGIICCVNQTLVRLLGYESPEILVGSNIQAILNIAGRIFFQTHLLPLLLLKGSADEIFLQLITKDRSPVPVIVNASRKTQNGIAVNHCLIIPAVQRSKYEQQLLEARRRAEDVMLQNAELNAAKRQLEERTYLLDQRISELKTISEDLTQFGKLMSHDIQEPIRKIAIYADRLSTQYDKIVGEDAIAQLRIIHQQCGKLRTLATSLEQYISLNVHATQPEELDLNETINVALKTAARAEEGDGYVFHAAHLPSIRRYKKEMEMLFYHLLRNSLRYRAPARPPEIRVDYTIFNKNSYRQLKDHHRYSEYVQISLTDNGIGFDPGAIENSFKIEKKASGDLRPLSFGLAFCKKVVDNHSGTIAIESSLGLGTTVIITLPKNLSNS